jgi:subtilase family serine protease
MPRKTTVVTLAAASTLLAAVLVVPTTSANAASSPFAVPNSTPTWIAKAKNLGHADGKAAVSARVYLSPRGGLTALAAAAKALSTPGSASYGKFLTQPQYAATYQPTSASVKQLSAWLTANGLHVAGVAANNQYISVTGDVAAANKAFSTTIDSYQNGTQTVQAPSSSLKVPASLASTVLTISGVDTTAHLVTPNTATPDAAPPPPGFNNAQPCSHYYGQVLATYQADFVTPLPTFKGSTLPYAVCGYTGPQLRAAYEGNTTLTGKGVTVAITDAYGSPTMAFDANKYATENGDGSYVTNQYSQTINRPYNHTGNGPLGCGENGWYGEETLDVEAVHAMAPAAKIRYYGAASCYDNDFLDTLALVVTEDKAQIVTNSWGEPESDESADVINAYEAVFLQGALEGISFAFSSGDDGDELANTGLKQTDYPDSDPYVTAVGGTSTAIGSDGSMLFETGWGTEKYSLSTNHWASVGYLYGAGGGASGLFERPDYQTGVAHGNGRQVPDVAMDADPTTGMLVGETQTFNNVVKYGTYRIGGTSLASPLFAGMTALKIQKAKHPFGILNYAVYSSLDSFTDVAGPSPDQGNVRVDFVNGINNNAGLVYSVRTFNQDSSLKLSPGWDNITGVGSPNSGWLQTPLPPR